MMNAADVEADRALFRKALLEEENAEKKKHTLATLEEGKVFRGMVKTITNYGAFIDLGGLDGLLHVTDMSWGWAAHPSELLKVHDVVDVVVLKFDRATERVSLGYKQPTAVEERYQVGMRLSGKVARLANYGAFIELEPGVHGLLHVSEMSWSRRAKHVSKLRFTVGDTVESMVLSVDPQARRITLGLKQLHAGRWTTVEERYQVGMRLLGKVDGLADYGAFIELEPGVHGLLHVSEMSWSRRAEHPSKLLAVGDTVESMVLGVDAQARRISLGLKQLHAEPWTTVEERYQVGKRLSGKVINLTDYGAFVEVEEGIDGLIHISNMPSSEVVQKGDEVESMVLDVDPDNRRLSLGQKQLAPDFRRICDKFVENHKVGSVVEGRVVRITDPGAFVELAEGLEEFIRLSGRNKAELKVDDVISVKIMKIIELSPLERKIRLSIGRRSHSAGWRLWLQGRGERIREVVSRAWRAVWSMVRESGGRGGSRAPWREQDSRDERIGERKRENAEPIHDLARSAALEER